MLKKFAVAAAACAVAFGAVTTTPAPARAAAEVTLRFAHFWPAVAALPKEVFEGWAQAVEKESNGRIKVEIYPAQTLAKAPAQYEAVANGIADVTATVLGYTANRFPLTQIVELPGVTKNGVHGSCVLQGLFDEGLLDSEYTDTKPLFMFTHGPGHLHTNGKAVRTPEDLAGLRIRRPTTVMATLLEEAKAQPVGMPAPDAYQSMQRGVIDGVALPWEGMTAFRLNELSKSHTEVGGLYTIAFTVTMNKNVYAKLPDDLKKVIDNNSGKAWANRGGKSFDGQDVKGRAEAVAAGHEIITVEGGADNPAWQPLLAKVTLGYLTELEGKGMPARKIFNRAKELAANCPTE